VSVPVVPCRVALTRLLGSVRLVRRHLSPPLPCKPGCRVYVCFLVSAVESFRPGSAPCGLKSPVLSGGPELWGHFLAPRGPHSPCPHRLNRHQPPVPPYKSHPALRLGPTTRAAPANYSLAKPRQRYENPPRPRTAAPAAGSKSSRWAPLNVFSCIPSHRGGARGCRHFVTTFPFHRKSPGTAGWRSWLDSLLLP